MLELEIEASLTKSGVRILDDGQPAEKGRNPRIPGRLPDARQLTSNPLSSHVLSVMQTAQTSRQVLPYPAHVAPRFTLAQSNYFLQSLALPLAESLLFPPYISRL